MGDDFSRTDGGVHRKDPPRDPPEPVSTAEVRDARPMPVPEPPSVLVRVVGPPGQGAVTTERRSSAPRLPPGSTRIEFAVHACVLPYRDPDASVAFYRDVLGWQVRARAGDETVSWIEVGPSAPDTVSIVLVPFAEYDGDSGTVHLSTGDGLDTVLTAVLAIGGEVVQEPADRPWGVRDLALRDPAGNTVRIREY